jgi:hypothetical protein
VVLTSGRVIEHQGQVALGGSSSALVYPRLQPANHESASAALDAVRLARIKQLLPTANLLIGTPAHERRVDHIPLSRVKGLVGINFGNHFHFEVTTAAGKLTLGSVAIADVNDVERPVVLDPNDPHWWANGVVVEEPAPQIRGDFGHEQKEKLLRLLPTADRVVYDLYNLSNPPLTVMQPLALLDHQAFHNRNPQTPWVMKHPTTGGSTGPWVTRVALSDRKGKQVVLDPTAGWENPVAKKH